MVPTRSSSVPLDRVARVDRLADNEESDLDVVNSIRNRTCVKKHINAKLDDDQGEEITQKLELAAKQLMTKYNCKLQGNLKNVVIYPLLLKMICFVHPLRQHHFNKVVRENVLLPI